MADPIQGTRRCGKKSSVDPDAALARVPGVQYRYTMTLREPGDAHGIFKIADELGAIVRYLVLVRDGAQHRYRAYLGLGSSDCFDLPLRLAARGIQVERGEQITNEPAARPARAVTVLHRR